MVYNTKIIDYGDFLHVQHFDQSICRVDFPKEEQKAIDDFEKEAIKNDLQVPQDIPNDPKRAEHCLNVSVNRSKNNLFRIARSNEWDLFVTLTFRREDTTIDCSDYNQVSKALTTWLNNLKSRYCPDLKYLAVPELHDDKIHYHFHLLFANCENLPLEFSGHYDKLGSEIYNITGNKARWNWGFSTASYIKDQSKVRNYIGKYITKDLMNNLKYKKRYYASQNVNLCEEEYYLSSLDELYSLYGDNMSYIKTINVNGVNRIHYMEIKKIP